MDQAPNLIITVRLRSPVRRFWREFGALVWWGLQRRVYSKSNAPFSVLGHESFRVSKKNGRAISDEVELTFFEHVFEDELPREMLKDMEELARRHGYSGVYYRVRGR